MDEKGKPGFGFWPAVTLLVMVEVYSLSTGPAVWIMHRAGEPEWLGTAIEVAYAPLESLADYSPAFMKCARWYINLWTP